MSTHELNFDAPEGFTHSELMVTFKGPDITALREPRAMQSQFPIRPNLIVHKRAAAAGATVEMLAAEMCAELLTSIDGLKDLNTEAFTFSDKSEGRLVSFDFAAGKAMTVRQFQAIRLDGAMVSTVTLTLDSAALNEEIWHTYKSALASLGA